MLRCGAQKSLFVVVGKDDNDDDQQKGWDPLVLWGVGRPDGSLLSEATQLLIW